MKTNTYRFSSYPCEFQADNRVLVLITRRIQSVIVESLSLDQAIAECKRTGESLGVDNCTSLSLELAKGERKPKGFNEAKHHYHFRAPVAA
ncbi:MAG: hypothetical protein ACRC1W_14950 [Shewanella sp.]